MKTYCLTLQIIAIYIVHVIIIIVKLETHINLYTHILSDLLYSTYSSTLAQKHAQHSATGEGGYRLLIIIIIIILIIYLIV